MVTETNSISAPARQQSADPIAAAILAHKRANAAYLGAFDRLCHLIGIVDPDLDLSDLDEVRSKLTAHYGAAAPAKIDELLTAREVSSTLGDAEEVAWEHFATIPLETAEQVYAYVAYVKAHAPSQDGAETVLLWRAMDRLAALLGQRLAA